MTSQITLLLTIITFFTVQSTSAQKTNQIKIEEEARETTPDLALLKIFKEPHIKNTILKGQSEHMRFIWMRTFHAPIAIRAFRDKDGTKLRIIRLSGKGGYGLKKVGKINFDKTVSINKKDWEHLKALIKKPNVIQPFKGLTNDQIWELAFLDGSTWYLELKNANSYSSEAVETPEGLIDFIGKEKEFKADFTFPNVRNYKAVCDKLLSLARSAAPKLYEEEDNY